MLIIVLIIVAVVIIVDRRSNKSSNNDTEAIQASEDIKKINDEILAELEKPEPDYEKLKTLRAEMDSLKIAWQKAQSEPQVQPEKSTNNNLNGLTIALYVGSLLILAGVGGLVISGAKEFGLLLLLIMTIVFYGGGILIRNNETLKIASHVFVGTGMLVLPFLGLLIHDVIKIDPNIIWLMMSLLGVPMYIFATYIMQNKVFAYFSIAGLVSLSCSLASTMGIALVWYFVFVMVVGFGLKILSLVKINEKLGVMLEPVQQAGDWLPLATFVASLMAFATLKEFDYVIILGVALLHLIMGYILKPNIGKENLFRLMLSAWIILLVHFIVPSDKTIGITLECIALAQTLFAIFSAKKGLLREEGRRETETAWLIISMICFVVAGLYIGSGNVSTIWAWVAFGLVVDSVILFIARQLFKQDAWYAGLLITGVSLPITIVSALEMKMTDTAPILAAVYLLEMVGMEALFWKNKEENGDVLTAASVVILGFAATLAGINNHLTSIVLLLAALCFWTRGASRKNNTLKEMAIYCVTAGVYFIIDYLDVCFGLKLGYETKAVLIGHLALIGLIISSVLWDSKEKPRCRLIIGCIVLLFIVGLVAIFGASWAMYLFLVETVGILLSGVFLKDAIVRNTGAVGAFLAVLWFTKDLSFVWPIILGLGIIGVVILILMKNGRNSQPKPPMTK